MANPAWAATRVPASEQAPNDEAIQRARVGERRVAVLKLEALIVVADMNFSKDRMLLLTW